MRFMKYLIAILYETLIAVSTSALHVAAKLMLQKYISNDMTYKDYLEALLSMNSVLRKALKNIPETHRLATFLVIDYFEIHVGKVVVPE